MIFLLVVLSLAVPLGLGIWRRRYYTFFVVLLLLYSLLVPLNIPGQFDGIGPLGLFILIDANLIFSAGIAAFEYINRDRPIQPCATTKEAPADPARVL